MISLVGEVHRRMDVINGCVMDDGSERCVDDDDVID